MPLRLRNFSCARGVAVGDGWGEMALTLARLRTLRPRSRRYEVADRNGLFVEVLPSGRMTWRYRYRFAGKREKLTLGAYPALGLKEARGLHLAAWRSVLLGESPVQAAQARKRAARLSVVETRTMTDIAKPWVESVLRPGSRSAWQDEAYLHRDVLPRLGRLKPEEVTTADVWACVQAVRDRGHGQAARRVRNVIRRLLDYAESQGLVRGNSAQPVRPAHIAPARSRSRTLGPDELPRWFHAIHRSGISAQNKLALHFLLLMPARKGELVKARWADVDLASGLWDVPMQNSKNGAPIRHRLSRQALEVMRKLHALAGGSEWVLPSPRSGGRKHRSTSTLNQALLTIDHLPPGVVIHDLRRTIRTQLSEMGGVPAEVAELCLNHRPKGVHGVYDRSERLDERAVALQRWADRLDRLLAGEMGLDRAA